MKLVVDFNVLFSSFRKFSSTRRLVFSPSLQLFSPEFARRELSKYRERVMSKANIGIGEFGIMETALSWKVAFVPSVDFKDFLTEAQSISPDADDIEYFALALKLDCPFWSEDRLLKKQGIVRVITTSELLKELTE